MYGYENNFLTVRNVPKLRVLGYIFQNFAQYGFCVQSFSMSLFLLCFLQVYVSIQPLNLIPTPLILELSFFFSLSNTNFHTKMAIIVELPFNK
jgi:hypothetical protein